MFNFVLSRSTSETVPFGTVSTANLPVSVNFDDYNYWGIEGGQRFFFSRVRFSPFIGYLVGANRHGDIRAEFVDVPANLLPGYAAQDRKMFEKSWAFSLAPPAVWSSPWARSRCWARCSSDSWADCRMSIGSSRRA